MLRMCAATLVAGVVLGFAAARWLPETVVEAQSGWQCRAWELKPGADASQVGTWLGSAKTVQVTSAAPSAVQFAILACKQ